ncbi:Eyes absent 3 [Phytophthora pseudosyringae]|uniref:Eyes absent 3 n=1 Tax=Phytophthora pseudosyringae TaxID=221518 RepID=A0A8T1W1L0_9STRA|nr:Eyes absent 3 [Phytophthora pseudosyringae]
MCQKAIREIAPRRGMLARGPPPPWAAPHSHTLATRNKTLQLMMAAIRARLGDAVAKLLLLPVVGVSLCGAVTLLLGLQWVEALQRQHQALRWRTRLWAALLARLLPSKRLQAVVTPHHQPGSGKSPLSELENGTSKLLNSGDKRDAHEGDVDGEGDGSYASRPLKRQKSEPGERDAAETSRQQEGRDDDEGDQGQAGDEEDKEEGDEETAAEAEEPKIPTKPRVRRRVFIWDLDETLVLFASLYTGTFAQMHGKEVAPGVALGEQMMTFLLAMLEKHFFFSDLHDADVDHIAHVAADSASRTCNVSEQQQQQATVQGRYERIREIYERRGHVDFLHDANSEWFAIRGALIAAIDTFSTGWLHEARQVLELIAESAHSREQPEPNPDTESSDDSKHEDEEVENVNVLVTNTQLVPALCKCLIYQLDAFFPIDRVYSSAKVHKYRCFETILEKYEAPDVEFVAIGDGLEEEHVSLALGLEFHKIRSLVDLKRLRYDLQLVQNNSNSSTPTAGVADSPAVAAAQLSVASSPVGQTAVV